MTSAATTTNAHGPLHSDHQSTFHDPDGTLVDDKLGDEKPGSYGHEQELQADVAEPDSVRR